MKFVSVFTPAGIGCLVGLSSFTVQAAQPVIDTVPRHVLTMEVRADDEPSLLTFSPDGKTLASGGENCPLQFWDVATGKEKPGLARPLDTVYGIQFSPDGRFFATSGSLLIGVQLWDARTGQLIRTLKEPYPASKDKHVQDFTFSPDGQTLWASASCCEIQRWEVASGKLLGKFEQKKKLYSFLLSPDGKTFATAGSLHEDANNCVDKTVGYLWDAQSGQLKRTIPDMGWPEAFSPDSSQLISRMAGQSASRPLSVWSVRSGQRESRAASVTLSGNDANTVIFSPNRRLLVTGHEDKSIRVMDARSGKKLQTLTDSNSIVTATFSPDGSTLATGEMDGHIHLWHVQR